MKTNKIPLRTNRILNFFLISLLLILIRVWYLSVVQYDVHYEESQKPKRRTVIERVERGTIRDRFNIPLAVNKMQYNAAICYADIRQMRRKERRLYIEKLSHFLAEALEMNPLDIEDTIYGKACLFPHTPFVLKEDIPEKLYHRLKMCERDWLGIQMQQTTKRLYPQGKSACDVIGYLGAIAPPEYFQIAQEIATLKAYLADYEAGKATFLPKGFLNASEVCERLSSLQTRAYTINDQVGKSGIEASFDELLHGALGKKMYEIDIKGNVLGDLPGGKTPIPGERLILSLSSELQLEAEKLLAEYEFLQDVRDRAGGRQRYHPLQRGGAIVVMHPKTGEILALASYPRFDPNDLVPAQSLEKRKENRASILKWLESDSYIGDIWDGKKPLEREGFAKGAFFTEETSLTWETYLHTILSEKSTLHKIMGSIDTIAKAVHLDEDLLDTIPFERDKLLLLDLIRMVAPKETFPESLLHHVEDQSLSDLRLFCQTAARHLAPLRELAFECFHSLDFRKWREENFKKFLKEKRAEELAKRRYARPYTEYLEREENEQFAAFWEDNRLKLLYAYIMNEGECQYLQDIAYLRKQADDPLLEELKSLLIPMQKSDRLAYLQNLRTYQDLTRPLIGKYPALRSQDQVQYEKHLAAAFYPYCGFGYGRSQAFRHASPMGSIFKVIPAYAGLKQQSEREARDLNPLTLTDDMQWTASPGSNSQVLGFKENGETIKRLYKGGRLPRAYPKIGKIDIVKALERSSNLYFSILAGDVLENPGSLLSAAMAFGLGSKTGIDLPGEYPGKLPDDIFHNKTGLYSFAIGQHSLIATPLQTAVVFSAIANGGEILKPQMLNFSAGKQLTCYEPKVVDTLDFSPELRATLLKGMQQVTNGERGSARTAIMREDFHNKEALKAYRKLAPTIVGKTGTAEILFKQTLDAESTAELEKHVWFGGISFKDKNLEEPELVVIVYSRFGSAGRQGAPIVAKLTQKWREIQTLH
ncbi:MAG: Penicillin-binding protein 2 [Chlamydiae bacterium]|nr:Penicillin-binding protein 2 [Chlamydiota bacterium]